MITSALVTERQQLAYLLRGSNKTPSTRRQKKHSKRSRNSKAVDASLTHTFTPSGKQELFTKKEYEKFDNGTTYLG